MSIVAKIRGMDLPSGSSTQSQDFVLLESDVINNGSTANSLANVTGLSFPVVAGSKYHFRFVIFYTAAATTTGSRWSINGPATSLLAYTSEWALAATTKTLGNYAIYDRPTGCNATSAATTGNIATIEGIIVPSADGTVIARFASEVSGSAITAKAGSIVYYRQVA